MNVTSDLLNLNSKSPAFSIVIEGKDVTSVLDTRLMSLTLTDNRGFEADQLDLELDDSDGLIVLPRRGAIIQFALGWKGQPLFPKGAFTVDEIEHSGAPDRHAPLGQAQAPRSRVAGLNANKKPRAAILADPCGQF